MAGRGDIDSLPLRAGQATTAVNTLSKGLENLGREGKVTYESVSQLLNGLGRLHPALGAVAQAAKLTILSFQLLEQVEKDFRLQSLSDDLRSLSKDFDGVAAGAKMLAEAEDYLQDETGELAKKQALIKGHLMDFHHEMAEAARRSRELGDAEEGQVNQLRDSAQTHLDSIQRLENEAEDLRRLIERKKEATEAEREFAETIARRNELFAFEHGGFDKSNALLGQRRAAIQSGLDFWREEEAQLRLRAEHEIKTTGVVSDATRARIVEIRAETAALEAQARVYDELAQIAANALGGIAVGAFDAYVAAMERSISINSLLSESTGRAMQNVLASVLKSVGAQAAAQAIMELAYGVAAMTPWGRGVYGDPAFHFKSAALFGSVAVLAGMGSAGLSVNTGGGGGGGSAGNDRQESGKTATVQLFIFGRPDRASLRDLARQVQEEMAAGDLG